MKKVNIFLTALTVLVVIGGVLAFKTKVPKEFGQCNFNNLHCDANPTTTFLKTTSTGGMIIDYDLIGKDCVLVGGEWICKTRVTNNLE